MALLSLLRHVARRQSGVRVEREGFVVVFVVVSVLRCQRRRVASSAPALGVVPSWARPSRAASSAPALGIVPSWARPSASTSSFSIMYLTNSPISPSIEDTSLMLDLSRSMSWKPLTLSHSLEFVRHSSAVLPRRCHHRQHPWSFGALTQKTWRHQSSHMEVHNQATRSGSSTSKAQERWQ